MLTSLNQPGISTQTDSRLYCSLMEQAIVNGNIALLIELLNCGFNFDATLGNETPWQVALSQPKINLNVLLLLLAGKAKPNQVSQTNQSILEIAVENNWPVEAVNLLFRCGVSADLLNQFTIPVLELFVNQKPINANLLISLLCCGAKLVSREGDSVLHIAIKHEWPEELINKILSLNLIDPDLTNQKKETAFTLLLNRALEEPRNRAGAFFSSRSLPFSQALALLFIKHGASINSQNNAGDTLLHLAAAYDPTWYKKLLIEYPSARIDIPNNAGHTALNISMNPKLITSRDSVPIASTDVPLLVANGTVKVSAKEKEIDITLIGEQLKSAVAPTVSTAITSDPVTTSGITPVPVSPSAQQPSQGPAQTHASVAVAGQLPLPPSAREIEIAHLPPRLVMSVAMAQQPHGSLISPHSQTGQAITPVVNSAPGALPLSQPSVLGQSFNTDPHQPASIGRSIHALMPPPVANILTQLQQAIKGDVSSLPTPAPVPFHDDL